MFDFTDQHEILLPAQQVRSLKRSEFVKFADDIRMVVQSQEYNLSQGKFVKVVEFYWKSLEYFLWIFIIKNSAFSDKNIHYAHPNSKIAA